MTVNQIYLKAREDAGNAWTRFTIACADIRDGNGTERDAINALNSLIALAYRMQQAALEKEPAPLPKKPQSAKPAANAKRKEDAPKT